MRVFVHHGKVNVGHDFEQVPAVGEYVTLSVTGEPFRVELVLHCPFNTGEQRQTDYQAEIWLTPAKSMADVLRSHGLL